MCLLKRSVVELQLEKIMPSLGQNKLKKSKKFVTLNLVIFSFISSLVTESWTKFEVGTVFTLIRLEAVDPWRGIFFLP